MIYVAVLLHFKNFKFLLVSPPIKARVRDKGERKGLGCMNLALKLDRYWTRIPVPALTSCVIWASYLIPLRLSFTIRKVGITVVLLHRQRLHIREALATVPGTSRLLWPAERSLEAAVLPHSPVPLPPAESKGGMNRKRGTLLTVFGNSPARASRPGSWPQQLETSTHSPIPPQTPPEPSSPSTPVTPASYPFLPISKLFFLLPDSQNLGGWVWAWGQIPSQVPCLLWRGI